SFAFRLPALYQDRLQQLPDLPFLHLKLRFIGHGLIHAASAGGKRTAHRFPRLQRRFLLTSRSRPCTLPFRFFCTANLTFCPGMPFFTVTCSSPVCMRPLV